MGRGFDTGGENSFVGQQSTLLDAVADPVYVLDAEDSLTRVNDAMVELTGYERSELLGRKITELVPTRSYEQLREQRDELLDSETESATTELTIITNEGELIATEANVTVQQRDDGTFAGSVGTLRDIRERKQRERNLDLLKEVLTRVFRHNVRNELMVAQTHTELLESEIDPALHTHTAEILEASDRLLAHSEKARQIETVIEHDTQSEVDLVAAVTELVDTAKNRHPDATITVDLPTELTVQAHPNIDTAVAELIDNAIRHAPEKSQLEIWVDRDGNRETLFFEDDSGGLEPEEIQVLRSETEGQLQHGSGVGLWLVRWLAEYSGAELIVHTTSTGTVVGIRFGGADSHTRIDDSPMARAPQQIREHVPERFHGDTVIGRSEALDQLDERYDSLDRKGGHTVLVTGEAGIGKTTLVEQFQQRLGKRDDPPQVATGVCNETIQPPYYAFRQILRELPGEGGVLETVPSVEDTDELAEDKEALFEEIADSIRDLAAEQPVVLVVEDMQWADEGTIALFEYLVEEVGRWRHPVLFVGTYRTSDVEETHPVLEIADETAEASRGTVLELEPLGESEVESLLSHMLDIEDLPKSFTAEFHEHTGGTPLFVQELGRHFAEMTEQVIEPADLPTNLGEIAVPDTVERTIENRLESLPKEVQPTLRLGAVIGTEFSFDVLREAVDEPVDTLIDAVEILVKRRVWTRSGNKIGFAHGVVREQTLAGIDDDSRTWLHERVATAIEAVHGDALDEYAARLANHYEQAGSAKRSFEYYWRAGDYASDRYANEDAIDHYERALSLADGHELSNDEEIATVTTELGKTLELIGKNDEAKECYKDNLRFWQQQGDREGEAECLDALGTVARKRERYERSEEFFERSIEIRQEIGDRKGEAAALRKLGNIALRQSEYELASEYYGKSLDRCREIGDRGGKSKCLHNLSIIAQQQGAYSQAEEYAEQAFESFRTVGDRKNKSVTLAQLGNIAYGMGSYDQSREYYRRSLEITREIGHSEGKAVASHNLGGHTTREGKYDRARELLKESLETKREIGDRRGEAVLLSDLARVEIRQGRYNQAREYITKSFDILEELSNDRAKALNLCCLAMTAIQENRDKQAHEQATEALDIAKRIENITIELRSLMLLGTVARKQESYDKAMEFLSEGLDVGNGDKNPHQRARIHFELARVALARGDIESARNAVTTAVDMASELGMVHDRARATHLHGRIAAESDSPDEAIDHWQQALDTFEDVGAPQDALQTLQRLIETCEEQDSQQWIDRAAEIFETAPDPVKDLHRDWLADRAVDIEQH